MPWSTSLREPIRLKDGRWIRTYEEAREIILALPKDLRHTDRWGHIAQLLMDVVDGKGDRADLHLYLTQNLAADNMLMREWRTRGRPR